MTHGHPHSLVEAFFADFDDAFATFDGDEITRRYAEPYVACRSDGTAEIFSSRGEVGSYFGSVVSAYHDLGVRHCTHRDLEVRPLGDGHVLASVSWDLRGSDGEIVVSWRQAYALVMGDGFRVRTSIEFDSPS